MPRRYSRSGKYTRRVKTVKYSNETYNYTGVILTANAAEKTQWETTMITAIDQQGVRKCKNFELTLTGGPFTRSSNGDKSTPPLLYALVYVPQGTKPSAINLGSYDAPASLYEPNQNVIMSGVWPGDLTAPFVKKTRLARNLNSGDSIALLLTAPAFGEAEQYGKNVAVTLNYAISF